MIDFNICYFIYGSRFDEFVFLQNNFICWYPLLKLIQMESRVLRYENDMSENTHWDSEERFVDFSETRYMPYYENTAYISLFLCYVKNQLIVFLISTESGIKLKGRISFLIKINSYSTKGELKKLVYWNLLYFRGKSIERDLINTNLVPWRWMIA